MSKIRILIADDNDILRKSLTFMLKTIKNFEVVGEACDGEEAIQLTKECIPDVVLMDLGMPKIDGIKATRKIKNLSPATEVLVLTGHKDDQHVFPALRAGASGYILKESKSDELVSAIQEVVDGSSPLSSEISRLILDEFQKVPQKKEVQDIDEQAFVSLTEREEDILKLLTKGLSNQQIASELNLSEKTIRNQITGIYRKLEVNARTEALIKAIKLGLVEL